MRSVTHQKYRTFALCIEYGWKIYENFWYILAICIEDVKKNIGQDRKKI
jgi:hypothetical protein